MEIILSKLDIIDDIKDEIRQWCSCYVCGRAANRKLIGDRLVCYNCRDYWVKACYDKHLAYIDAERKHWQERGLKYPTTSWTENNEKIIVILTQFYKDYHHTNRDAINAPNDITNLAKQKIGLLLKSHEVKCEFKWDIRIIGNNTKYDDRMFKRAIIMLIYEEFKDKLTDSRYCYFRQLMC